VPDAVFQRLLLAAALGLASLCLPPALRHAPAGRTAAGRSRRRPNRRVAQLAGDWRGTLIAEQYARGVRPDAGNVKSASGHHRCACLYRHRLPPHQSVREPIVSYFPSSVPSRSPEADDRSRIF
jgi:hypothetical protein